MTRKTTFRAAAVLACAVLLMPLGACSGRYTADDDDVVSGLGSALTFATAAVGLASAAAGGSSGGGYSRPAPSTRSTYVAPTGNGYSQKGAFDDCARLYGSVGASAQMAECKRRSANMSSLN